MVYLDPDEVLGFEVLVERRVPAVWYPITPFLAESS